MLNALVRERWQEVESLLDAALDLEPDRRAAFLNAACDSDPALRAEVERLLRSCERAEGLLPKPAAEACASLLASFTADEVPTESRIGPYRIVREAGRGGMGTVYVAERADDQYRKRVALKLVRRGLDDTHLVRRFLEERQILASLDHPHIAQLLDGGVMPGGLPWYAMEYVDGLPMDRYCDEHRLSVERRLRLFLDVCEAVQYAHRNLVVHRDLKPSNILVTADGEVKLLDFGIAKLLAQSDAPGEALTRTGFRAMTPEYASPEQVRGDAISTASDVYSLGIVLYELLTGQRPYRLGGRAPHEIERAILGEQPERPSTVAGRGGADTAMLRGMTPDRLCRRLRGDLDTIVLTAMRKEPDRRYATAEQLAADIRRHLDGLPVAARRDTWRYRAGKFVGRHPAGVASAAAFALLLSGASVVTMVQSARTAHERDKAEQISTFLVDLLRAPDPYRGRGGAITVRELLDSAVARIDRELIGQPELRAELLSVMGRSYWGLGLPSRSRAILESAITLRQRTRGDAFELLQDQATAGRIAFEESDYAAAESLGRASLATGRRLFGERHPSLTPALLNLTFTLRNLGRDSEADSLLLEAVAIQRTQPRDSIGSLATTLAAFASSRWARADWVGADTLYREALALRREALGDEHPDVGAL
ncbi:MAG TPA: protein kinase [Gemmatimonadales bacterium]|nr:protein kinase [Gemmatimonadales bacterium]